jgi:hypothetical protein
MPSPSRLAALALAALLPLASFAQEAASSGEEPTTSPPVEDGFWYTAARLGAALPVHRDLKDNYPGFIFEGSTGYQATRHLALELGLGYFSLTGCDDRGFHCGDSSVPGVGAWSALAAAKAVLPFKIGQLYAVGGAGAYLFRSVVPGAFVGGGALVRVAPGTHLGVEAKYFAAALKVPAAPGCFWCQPPTVEPAHTVRLDSLLVMAGIWASL